MKNILKGGSTTLIFISSLVILMLSLSGCIGGGDNIGSKDYIGNILQGNSDITYPNSKPCSEVPMYYYSMVGITQDGITISTYETSDTVENILNWYENKITSMGYDAIANVAIVKISHPQGTFEYGGRIFKKGDDAIAIWAIREPNQERTIYFIGKGPADKLLGSSYESSEYTETEDDTTSTIYNYEEEKPQLPTSDKVSGEEPVKRYPGSVMLEYSALTMGNIKIISIKYGTDKDPQEVFNWYNDYIKNEGWNIVYTASEGSTYSIGYLKNNNEKVGIEINKWDYTTIDITYEIIQS